jgi:hypothetical protein
LLSAEYTVSTCSKEGYPLATFLKELVAALRQSGPTYDLLIIDVSGAAPVDEILAPLEYLVTEQPIPLILVVEEQTQGFELLQAHVAVVPVLFRTLLHVRELFDAIEVTTGVPFPYSVPLLRLVQQRNREYLQTTIHAKQAWMTTRQHWLNQRQEWISQRQQWLCQRLEWIDEQRQLADPQLEWLAGQQAWVEQQLDEVNQQQRWVQHHRHWLDQQQGRIDQLRLELPLTNVE